MLEIYFQHYFTTHKNKKKYCFKVFHISLNLFSRTIHLLLNPHFSFPFLLFISPTSNFFLKNHECPQPKSPIYIFYINFIVWNELKKFGKNFFDNFFSITWFTTFFFQACIVNINYGLNVKIEWKKIKYKYLQSLSESNVKI